MHYSTEQLQAFLDHELKPSRADSIRRHLAGCPVCRRELSRMRLLWLELEQDEEIGIPLELPFIRQQAISSTRRARKVAEYLSGTTLWEAQKLAWRPALVGAAQIPGPRQVMRLARVTGGGLPAVIRGVSSVLGRLTGRKRDRP